MLIVLGGLPGAGKTTIARELARAIGAAHVRVDSIYQAVTEWSGRPEDMLTDVGYRVGYAVAEDNLRLGLTVIADSVNPVPLSRDAWLRVANRAQVAVVEVEIECSDRQEHRRRIEQRFGDLPGLPALTWQDVVNRDYRPWDREHLVIDTAVRTVEQCVAILRAALPAEPLMV
jgi:predicted kinase